MHQHYTHFMYNRGPYVNNMRALTWSSMRRPASFSSLGVQSTFLVRYSSKIPHHISRHLLTQRSGSIYSLRSIRNIGDHLQPATPLEMGQPGSRLASWAGKALARLICSSSTIKSQGNARHFKEEPFLYGPGGFHLVALEDKFRDGRYIILRKIGYGEYSTVWLAHDSM